MIDPVRLHSDEPARQAGGSDDHTVPSNGPGGRLGDERRRQGLSLGDIARQLKLSVRQIEALERDDYNCFSGMVFVRGFMRNYAKLLQLDAEALVAQLPGTATPAAMVGEPVQAVPMPQPAATPGGKRGYGWLIAALVFGGLLLAAMYEGRQHRNNSSANAPVQIQPGAPVSPQHAESPPAGLAAPMPGAAAQSATAAASAVAVAPVAAPASPLPATPPPTPAPSPAALPAEPARAGAPVPAATPTPVTPAAAPTPAPASAKPAAVTTPVPPPTSVTATAPAAPATAPKPPAPAAPPAGGQLRLKFDAEAWVEVKDGSGALVFSQLGTAGSEQVVQGRPPLHLVIGNAHAVKVTYQGRVVDLGPHTRVDVARLVLE